MARYNRGGRWTRRENDGLSRERKHRAAEAVDEAVVAPDEEEDEDD